MKGYGTYCKYLSKTFQNGFKCKLYKKHINLLLDCKNCSKFILATMKPINKVSSKRIFVTDETYKKVYERDKGICQLCGTSQNLQLHHILGRGKTLTNDINNCIMLCENCHLNVVHKNQKKYRPILLEKNKKFL